MIMGDDIGLWDISAYNHGMMGYRTPNIDRIAREGAIFTDYYGQQSCTDRVFLLVPAQVFVGRYIQSLAEFPPRQRPGSFNLQGVMDKLTRPPEGVN